MKSLLLKISCLYVVVLLTRADGDSPDLRIGLESYWPMDGDMNDWLTGAAGVVTGAAVVVFGAGLDEGGLIADVPGGSVALAHGITPVGGELSASFWFTSFGLGGPGQVFLQDGAAWRLHRNSSTDEMALSAAGATVVLPGDWEDGAWHHIAFTVRSGGSLIVRADGAPAGEATAGTLLAGSGMISVGADPALPADSVGMCLEEVAMWTRQLTTTELECLEAPWGGNLASLLGPAPGDYVPAVVTLARDPDLSAILTWEVPAGMIENHGIEYSGDLLHWTLLDSAETTYRYPIPATPGAKGFFRVYRKIEP